MTTHIPTSCVHLKPNLQINLHTINNIPMLCNDGPTSTLFYVPRVPISLWAMIFTRACYWMRLCTYRNIRVPRRRELFHYLRFPFPSQSTIDRHWKTFFIHRWIPPLRSDQIRCLCWTNSSTVESLAPNGFSSSSSFFSISALSLLPCTWSRLRFGFRSYDSSKFR